MCPIFPSGRTTLDTCFKSIYSPSFRFWFYKICNIHIVCTNVKHEQIGDVLDKVLKKAVCFIEILGALPLLSANLNHVL